MQIPLELKCPCCGGRNLCPDPSLYFWVRVDGWGCLDCQETKKNEEVVIEKDS